MFTPIPYMRCLTYMPYASHIGGTAGGDKYCVHGILMKLTTDPKMANGLHLYGGFKAEYNLAGKAAAHGTMHIESLLTCRAIVNCRYLRRQHEKKKRRETNYGDRNGVQ